MVIQLPPDPPCLSFWKFQKVQKPFTGRNL